MGSFWSSTSQCAFSISITWEFVNKLQLLRPFFRLTDLETRGRVQQPVLTGTPDDSDVH